MYTALRPRHRKLLCVLLCEPAIWRLECLHLRIAAMPVLLRGHRMAQLFLASAVRAVESTSAIGARVDPNCGLTDVRSQEETRATM